MSTRLVQDLLALEPRSWEELAAAARFLTGVYGESLRAEALALSRAGTMSGVEYLAASFLLTRYAALHDHAYAIHLGARAAAMEAKDGAFAILPERIARLVEAGGSGAIIHGFINAARILVTTNTLFKEDTSAGIAKARDLASQDIFDGALERIEEHDRLLGPTRPQASTILDIVGAELAILPRPLKESIQRVLDFKGGPK